MTPLSRTVLTLTSSFIILTASTHCPARDLNSDKYSLSGGNYAVTLSDNPILLHTSHNVGKIQLQIGNNGIIGGPGRSEDILTGLELWPCTYPKNSELIYLYVASLWIGAVKGRDTLVSTAINDYYSEYEFWADPPPGGRFTIKSIDPSSPYHDPDAYSEQDIVCVYTDTCTILSYTRPLEDGRPHIPLGIEVTQRSMAWSYDYADDFILFDYQVKNISKERLEELYMGIFIECDVMHETVGGGYWDDIVGFYRTHPARIGCGYLDTINVAWHTDNDGDPADGAWDLHSPTSAMGTRVIRTPNDKLRYSYNWWNMNFADPTRDFGPRQRGTADDPFRTFGTMLGTPQTDEDRYYILKHDEFDYDLAYTAVDHSDSGRGWLPPPEYADLYARGYADVRYILSFGPFYVSPGEKLPITFAWVGGENFHVDPTAFSSFNPEYPASFYRKLNFEEIATNARWALWVYDNPGVDTDGDGYYGKERTCCYDTILTDTGIVYERCFSEWYEGDGVPDFRGASPPPSPKVWLESLAGKLRVRLNGFNSETAVDPFSGVADFEGYRVYMARDNRRSSYSLVASYDRENYNKYTWDPSREVYRVLEIPFSRQELQTLYGDPLGIEDFDPLLFGENNLYFHPDFPDSVFYFAAQDYNRSEFGVTTPIRKTYPDQPVPSTVYPEEALPEELTEDGYFKYYEYEIIIENVLPTVPHFVSVTAFDFGSPEFGIKTLESSIINNAVDGYALTSAEDVEQQNLDAYVYPNPYRLDAEYHKHGFENRDGMLAPDRMRRIHFANLPRVCKISIYSIDGDLVRQFEHSYPLGGPEAMHDSWDLITRNTQAAVTGLYYWVVESENRTQIGKLVIIK